MNTMIMMTNCIAIGLLAANLIWMIYSHISLTKRYKQNEKQLKYLQEKYGQAKNQN